jgi:uncharacterized membrane protein YjjB (DUF3815 family)
MYILLMALLGSITSGLIFNVRGYKIVFAGLSGMAGYLSYYLMLNWTGQFVLSIFIGAVTVGFYSEIAARRLRTPSTVFSIPGIFAIVPGITAYEAITLLADNKLNEALGKIIETLNGAGAIAFGILIVTAIFRVRSKKNAGKSR